MTFPYICECCGRRRGSNTDHRACSTTMKKLRAEQEAKIPKKRRNASMNMETYYQNSLKPFLDR